MISEEISKKLERHRSVSETGSDRANGSLQHQKSVESADRTLRKRSTSADIEAKKPPAVGQKLIEAEKTERGSVKWEVYKHYLKSIGIFLTIITLLLNAVFQGFSIGSNVWLSVWSNDKEIVVNGTQDTGKRDMYLGVYGALGIGQGKFFLLYFLLFRWLLQDAPSVEAC